MAAIKWLLVDDDEDDREIFQMALSDAAPQVLLHTANDGADAIKKLKAGLIMPTLIFLDINMPWMNGLECLKIIKTDSSLKHVPVYMYSTSNDTNDSGRALKAGAAGYICKPADVSELTSTLRRLAEGQHTLG